MKLPLVYFIQDTAGHIKIGYSGVLNKRACSIAPASPYPCDLVATYHHPMARKIEKILHKILKDVRCEGEWFECSLDRALAAIPMACAILEKKNAPSLTQKPCPDKSTLAYRLVIARKAGGLTQQQMADAIGVAMRRYAHWEQGKYEPSVRYINALCIELGTTPNHLMGFDDLVEQAAIPLKAAA